MLAFYTRMQSACVCAAVCWPRGSGQVAGGVEHCTTVPSSPAAGYRHLWSPDEVSGVTHFHGRNMIRTKSVRHLRVRDLHTVSV